MALRASRTSRPDARCSSMACCSPAHGRRAGIVIGGHDDAADLRLAARRGPDCRGSPLRAPEGPGRPRRPTGTSRCPRRSPPSRPRARRAAACPRLPARGVCSRRKSDRATSWDPAARALIQRPASSCWSQVRCVATCCSAASLTAATRAGRRRPGFTVIQRRVIAQGSGLPFPTLPDRSPAPSGRRRPECPREPAEPQGRCEGRSGAGPPRRRHWTPGRG